VSKYKEAKDWMNIKRFECASATDGLLWAENIRVAALHQGSPWDKFSNPPRWLTRADLSDCAFLSFGHPDRYANPRDTETVTTLTTSSILEAIDFLKMEYDREEEMWFSEAASSPVDEVSNFLDPIASINLHAPDSVILEDFKKWLEESRSTFERKSFKKNRADRLSILKDNQVLPYIWLQAWSYKTGHQLTLAHQAKILFPDDDERYFDIDPVEKLRKRTMALAEDYIALESDGSINFNSKNTYFLRFLRINGNVS